MAATGLNATDVFLPTLYNSANDIPDQEAALQMFYSAVGGPYWQLDALLPNMLGALGSAPPAVVELLTDPNTTSAQKEHLYLESIQGRADDGISPALRLALYKLGLASVPWLTSGASYCAWLVFT